jgi:hypothetical protein
MRHYLLQGFFQHEGRLIEGLRDYYLNECGIGLLPFSRERLDWHQLIEVIEHFSRELSTGPLTALARRREMEELLK